MPARGPDSGVERSASSPGRLQWVKSQRRSIWDNEVLTGPFGIRIPGRLASRLQSKRLQRVTSLLAGTRGSRGLGGGGEGHLRLPMPLKVELGLLDQWWG